MLVWRSFVFLYTLIIHRDEFSYFRYSRSKSFSHRRRSSVNLRRASMGRRKSIDPLCIKVNVKDSDHDSVVDCLLFLQSRTHATETATLLTTGSGGWVRAWCMFGGGLAGEFMASNNDRESVLCMTSDENNERLMTGDTQGYIKIWSIRDFCIKKGSDGSPVNTKDRLVRNRSAGRRSASPNKSPPKVNFSENTTRIRTICRKAPPLILCLRAHLQPIVSIDYVPKHKLLITASTDCSVRLWSCNGQYVGTFGQRQPWNINDQLSGDGAAPLPCDLENASSSNSGKLLGLGWSIAKSFAQVAGKLNVMRLRPTDTAMPNEAGANSATMREAECRIDMDHILGKCYKPKTRHHMPPVLPKLKINQLSQVVVYSSLKCTDLAPIVEPKPPVVLFQTCNNPKPSSRIPSSQSEKDVADGRPPGRLPALSPRWKPGQGTDGGRIRQRSSVGARKGRMQDGVL